MAAAGLGSLAVTWWSSPIDKAGFSRFPRLSPLLFDARGITPIGYAAFAFALGVTIGMLIRRTLPAMAITLTAFAVIQIAMPLLIRPQLIAPVRFTTAITATNLNSFLIQSHNNPPVHVTVRVPDPGAWVISNQTINAAGHVVSGVAVSLDAGPCALAAPPLPPFSPACFTKISQLGYRQQVAYQPASRFWAFQWFETAIFLALSLGLAGFCFWWIRRRLS
jgi:hypothetical protein